ncbi:NAD(P)/FAD-dependent oxidoreductase [Gottschalkiaceae bacterium SANA]|nr:NAD(P)/FAD-dependent oxidoreductase [Gottschalkiaceae bacterium SANA]
MNSKNRYDVIIIGAGVIGCSIARELSRYKGRILLLEKENDVSNGASKANSGIVHGGYDAKHGSMKGYFSRKGNRMFEQLNQELNFGYLECGSMVLGYNEEDFDVLRGLKENGIKNGLDDLRIIEHDEILEREPYVNPDVKYALFCPTAGVTSPYEYTIALAENAIQNGVTLKLNHEVLGIEKNNDEFKLITNDGNYSGKYVINAAGLTSDKIQQMLGLDDFSIHPRRGEYLLLNKNQGHLANGVLFQTPSDKGKGILVTRTYHGNLMLGPNAQEVDDVEAVGTSLDALVYIVNTARQSVKDFDVKYTLTSFAGLRASSSRHDFIIEESAIKGFINVAGIESPGITSSPAIAVHVTEILEKSGYLLDENEAFDPKRKAIIVLKDNSFQGQIDDPDPKKNIICRCELVTEAEIVDSLHRGITIDHIDGVKRRTRCTMGACQGNFCTPRVKTIIAREMDIEESEVTARGKGSLSLPERENRMFWKKIES